MTTSGMDDLRMILKTTAASLILLMISVLMGSQAAAAASLETPKDCEALAEKYKALANHDPYVIALDPTNPPYEYVDPSDPNKVVGSDPSMAAAVMDCLKFPYKFEKVPFSGLIAALLAGQADIQWSSQWYSAKRAEAVDYVVYARDTEGVMTRKGHLAGAKSLDDLCGKTLSVVTGSVDIDVIRKQNDEHCHASSAGDIKMQTYTQLGEMYTAVLNERADAAMTNLVGLLRVAKTEPKFEVIFSLPQGFLYGVSIVKKREDLLNALFESIKIIQDSGIEKTILLQNDFDPDLIVPTAIYKK
jgi:polar amino acid transport system substrate-binding protein